MFTFYLEPAARIFHCSVWANDDTVRPAFDLKETAASLTFQRLRPGEFAEYVLVHSLEGDETRARLSAGLSEGKVMTTEQLEERSVLIARVAAGACVVATLGLYGWGIIANDHSPELSDVVNGLIVALTLFFSLWFLRGLYRGGRSAYLWMKAYLTGRPRFDDQQLKAEYPL